MNKKRQLLFLVLFVSNTGKVRSLDKCAAESSTLATSDVDCATKCASQDNCGKFRFANGTCFMRDVALRYQVEESQTWMSCIYSRVGNSSLTGYRNESNDFDFQEHFKTEAEKAGYKRKITFKIGSKTFTKYYMVVHQGDNPYKHWQASRRCLYHHGTLPVVHSVEEAKQVTENLIMKTQLAIPIGMDLDQSRDTLQWLDGFQVDKGCHEFVWLQSSRFGLYLGSYIAI